jgi:hypothetical protein
MMKIRKGYNLIVIFTLIGMLFIPNGTGYVYASSGETLRVGSLFQDEDRVDQLLRYMYGDEEQLGKGVIVYRKDTPEEKGSQVVLPVYEISWIMDNFSEKDLQAVIDALRRWKNPVHGSVLGEIIDILVSKDLSTEETAEMTHEASLAFMSKFFLELGRETPYRIYLAIGGEIDEAEPIEVEGFVKVLTSSYAIGKGYDSEFASVEIRKDREGKERFIGLGRQLLRYAAWRELQLGSKRVRFMLPGVAKQLQDGEGFDAVGLHTHAELKDFVLKGARKTIKLLEKDALKNLEQICKKLNKWMRLYYEAGDEKNAEIPPDEKEDFQRMLKAVNKLGRSVNIWAYTEPYENTFEIITSLDLGDGEPVLEIGPYNMLRYVAIAATGHPVLIVEEPTLFYKYEMTLYSFLDILQDVEPETFGKVRENITFVPADILTRKGQKKVEQKWDDVRTISGVKRDGAIMALYVFWAEEKLVLDKMNDPYVTGIFKAVDIQDSLVWIKEKLQPRTLILSEPMEEGKHDLWDAALGLRGSNIVLPVEFRTEGHGPILTRYRFSKKKTREALESRLIDLLSSNDTQKPSDAAESTYVIDRTSRALKELDHKISDPARVLYIIESVLEKRGLYLRLDKANNAIDILEKEGNERVGFLSFTNPKAHLLRITAQEVFVEKLKVRSVIPLVYRLVYSWMQAHRYFREELSISKVELLDADSIASSIWLHSGFERIEVSQSAFGKHDCSAMFRKWPKIEAIKEIVPPGSMFRGL